jgi:hypothetical protein
VVEWWSGGVVEWWSGGVVECELEGKIASFLFPCERGSRRRKSGLANRRQN